MCCAGGHEVVGVLAKLGTVKDVALSEVLAEHLHSDLACVVVTTSECQQRLASMLATARLPCPDVLPYDQLTSYGKTMPVLCVARQPLSQQ